MSTKSKLLAATEGLTLPPVAVPMPPAAEPPALPLPPAGAPASAAQFPPVTPTAKTGPGQMLQIRGQMLATETELSRLKTLLRQHEGSLPTRKLDPRLVQPSRWANRHEAAFRTPAFLRLKQDIELAGGNVQPIAVRALAGSPERYEVIFGHRRLQACAELGLPVLAMIATDVVSDHELFSAMDRENRERSDLSPYEQGVMYRRALDEGLYPSNRRLAEALGVSHTWVANVLSVADLPVSVIECFRSPLEVQHRHARMLAAALERDRKGVLRRAEKLRQQPRRPAAAAVVETLLGQAEAPREALEQPLAAAGRRVGSWRRDGAGRLTIQLDPAALSAEGVDELMRTLRDLVSPP